MSTDSNGTPLRECVELRAQCTETIYRECMNRDVVVVGLKIEGELPPWTEVKLRAGPTEWVDAPVEKWRAGLNPSLPVSERCDIFVTVAGLATQVSLVLVQETERTKC